jgi:GT2 family glycosyltransferase
MGRPGCPVSVVVVTRDRPGQLAVCLDAVLASDFREFELVVVDQSLQPASSELVESIADRDRRVRLVRDAGRGAARARNIGAAATSSEIIVFTDDDCAPDSQWLRTIVRALSGDAGAGIAYGTVQPAPHDRRDGFIVGFTPRNRARLVGRVSKLRDEGISANVAIRRDALTAAGGFDEMLGPGSYFPCAEDYDLTYRILARGYAVLHVPDARLIHYGLRDWQSGGKLVRDTYVAIGAAYMKHVRLGDMVAVLLLFEECGRAFLNIARNLVRLRSPFGFGRLLGLLLGARRSFELPVVASCGRYATPN